MKIWAMGIAVLLAGGVANSASAEDWKKVSEGDGKTDFLDVDSIKRAYGYIEATNRTDYASPGDYGELSTRAVMRYKCNARSIAVISLEDFALRGAKGRVVTPLTEMPAPLFEVAHPGSPAGYLMAKVCKSAK